MKHGNAGPKLHWLVWEKSGFPALAGERYFLAYHKAYGGDIWAKGKLFLAYCLFIRAILKEWQRKVGFGPIDSNAKLGPAFTFAICRENGDAMHEFTGNSRPAYSVYVTYKYLQK